MPSDQSDSKDHPVVSSTNSVISTDGVSIHYQVQGSGTPTLVFVHGWSCDQSYWNAQVMHFAPHYQVVTIDLAGHGASGLSRENWSISAFAQDTVAVLEHLDLNEAVLIGHSMGGPVVLEAALWMPERVSALVGVDTFFDRWALLTPEERRQRLAPFRTNFVKTTRKWVRQDLFAPTSDPNLVEKIVADMSAAPPEVGSAAMEGLYEWGKNDFRQAFEQLRMPLFIIQAESNLQLLQLVEGLASSLESFQVLSVPAVGHFVMMEDSETFNRLLAQIINKLPKSSPS
ncbi:alpha/beta hydrolase [Acidobacteria bacterium AH-259-D05]|nr:alpha/beta hydrolase [Acidobacteria bacterium AH-259-D05]